MTHTTAEDKGACQQESTASSCNGAMHVMNLPRGEQGAVSAVPAQPSANAGRMGPTTHWLRFRPSRHDNSDKRLGKMPGYARKREQKRVRETGDVSRSTGDRGCVTRARRPRSGKPHGALAKGKCGRGTGPLHSPLSPLAFPCSPKGDGRHIGNATYVVASHVVDRTILKVHALAQRFER